MTKEFEINLKSVDLAGKDTGAFPGQESLTERGLSKEMVRAMVIGMMTKGLSKQHIASSVRTESFSKWGGGLKSPLVGRLNLNVSTGLKLGGPELKQDMAVMRAINKQGKAYSVEPISLRKVDDKHYVLLMESLEKHFTMLELIYRHNVSAKAQESLVKRVFDAIQQVAAVNAPLKGIQGNCDPYSARLQHKLLKSIKDHDGLGLKAALHKPGFIGKEACPPVAELVEHACDWLRTNVHDITPKLAHGDPHLGNVMVRQRGTGYSFRLIDPNSEIGFTDYLYDIGKLLHWAQPLGWSQIKPDACVATMKPGSTKGWSLNANLNEVPKAAESRRSRVEHQLLELTRKRIRHPTDRARLHLSIAAAHAGLLFLYAEEEAYELARFAAHFAILELLRWRAISVQKST